MLDDGTEQNRACVNALVLDALRHVPAVVTYLASLRDASVFRFCAIPQVMAIATLNAVYNNANVFQIKVKISKAEACRIMLHTGDLHSALNMFAEYCQSLEAKLAVKDESSGAIAKLLASAQHQITTLLSSRTSLMPLPYQRSLFLRYPALGGRVLLTMVDSVACFFRGGMDGFGRGDCERGRVTEIDLNCVGVVEKHGVHAPVYA
uniref:Squalene synthase n=1 Tax=Lygus hesperus TaxID=30085 RepID=A0A146LCJ2_LYGHE